MSANLASIILSTLSATGPNKALRVLLAVFFVVDRTMAILVMIVPKAVVPIDFRFTCGEGTMLVADMW